MKYSPDFSTDDLIHFIDAASLAAYAGGGTVEKDPERPGFKELIYEDGDWSYRDSYTGFIKSRGMEVVRYQGEPVWSALYGGGMLKDNKELVRACFKFLKQALSVNNKGFVSFRGPGEMRLGEWEYVYEQEGDVEDFKGYEEIWHKEEIVFFHRVIGGMIVHKPLTA